MPCIAESMCSKQYLQDANLLIEKSLTGTNPDDAVFAPFVRVVLQGFDGQVITIGNNSYPPTNTASIKSFQWNFSGTKATGTGICSCEFEIVDEDGGDIQLFFDKLYNKFDATTDKFILQVQWGWNNISCANPNSVFTVSSQLHTLLMVKMRQNVGEIITFTLTGMPIPYGQIQGASNKTYGQDDQPMSLKDAIRQMFKNATPPINNVIFGRRRPDGSMEDQEWEFSGGTNWPTGTWRTGSRNPLDAMVSWIKNYCKTDANKGIIPLFPDTYPEPTLLLLEDPNPVGSEQKTNDYHLADYVVNAGNCSRVVEFSSNIEFNWGYILGNTGIVIDPTNSKVVQQGDVDDGGGTPDKDAGLTTHSTVDDNAIRNYGKNASDPVVKSGKTMFRSLSVPPITAELKIIGDPTIDDQSGMWGRTIGLIVINPIHLKPTSQRCAQWLSTTTCNTMLSNKGWIVQGVAHDIRDGVYVTIFDLLLLTEPITSELLPVGDNNSGEPLEY